MIPFETKHGGKEHLSQERNSAFFLFLESMPGIGMFVLVLQALPECHGTAGLACLKSAKKMDRIQKEKYIRKKEVTLSNLGDLFLAALY